jgi:hypothetical protein
MESYLTTLSQYSKDFEIETQQIHFWFNSLKSIKSQVSILKESMEGECRMLENFGKSKMLLIKGYINDTLEYSDESSQLWTSTSIFTSLVEGTFTVYQEDVMKLMNHINKNHNIINEDIDSLIKSITENSTNMMKEILQVIKNSKHVQNKLQKLKSDLESSHQAKKKVEMDPKTAYNVTAKEKAEQKILAVLREIQDLHLVIDSLSKEVANKKEHFNNTLKDTFELVISNIFINNVRLKQTFFLVAKEKWEMYSKVSSYSVEKIRNIRNMDLHLNDYVERKYAETKELYFDSIESIFISEDIEHSYSIISKASEDVMNYSQNFYNCMVLRRRILKKFCKFIIEAGKSEELFSVNSSKANKTLQQLIADLNLIGGGSTKAWSLFKNMLDARQKLHDGLGKFLTVNINAVISTFISESKTDYTNFLNNWQKYAKDVNHYRNIFMKNYHNREKIQLQIKQLRANVEENGQNKLEVKLNSLNKEETSARETLIESGKKLRISLNNSLEFLKKIVKLLREKEFKRLNSFFETLENISKTFIKSVEHYIDQAKGQMDISANVDIYSDIKEIYSGYFKQYKISETYFNRIIKKVIKTTDFNSEDQEGIFRFFNNHLSGNMVMSMTSPERERPENTYKEGNSQEFSNVSYSILKKERERQHRETPIFSPDIDVNNTPSYLNFFKIDGKENSYISDKRHLEEENFSSFDIGGQLENKLSIIANQPFIEEGNKTPTGRVSNHLTFKNNISEEDEESSFNPLNRDEMKFTSNLSNQLNPLDKPQYLYETNTIEEMTEENVDFINPKNFNMFLNHRPTYGNINERELREYMDKLNHPSTHFPSGNTSIGKNLGNNFQSSLKLNSSNSNTKIASKDSNPGLQAGSSNNLSKDKEIDLIPLDSEEEIIQNFSCAFSDKILLQGKLYVTNKKLVFHSWFNGQTLFGATKLIIPKEDVIKVEKRYNLKIFNNSILIVTKRSELFFTSFVYRDQCYELINKMINNKKIEKTESKKMEEDMLQDEQEAQVGVNEESNIKIGGVIDKKTFITKLLRKIDFLKRLEKVHQQRIQEFDSLPKEQAYRPEKEFKKFYMREESLGKIPLNLVFQYIFDQEQPCDELNRGKTFWESLYEIRNDTDITSETSAQEIPKFFKDLEYFLNIFANFEEEEMVSFLDEIPNWNKFYKYNYKLTHPIKKKMFGPDKVILKEDTVVYFVSPKLMIVEVISVGSGFPYCDTFINVTQWRFNTEYKYVSSEGTFKFETNVSCMFLINFLKSCMFKSVIESEGYKESEEALKGNNFEKIKCVLIPQEELFTQQFNKMAEENQRKVLNMLIQNEKHETSHKLEDEGNNPDSSCDSMPEENIYDKKGWKVAKSSEFEIDNKRKSKLISSFPYDKILYILVALMAFVILTKVEFSIGLDKLLNVIIVILLSGIFYKFQTFNSKNN